MTTPDFFRSRIDAMINLNDPLAVLATRLPWAQLEESIAAKFARSARAGAVVDTVDLFGPSQTLVGAGFSAAGRPRLPLRLMISLLYLKHIHGRPRFAKRSVRDDTKVKIAPVHPDFGARRARCP